MTAASTTVTVKDPADLQTSSAAETSKPTGGEDADIVIDITVHNLQPLVTLRQSHQTEQARKGVRNYVGQSSKKNGAPSSEPADLEEQLSTRQHLTQQINSIIHRAQERGSSTGLNRITRWTESVTGTTAPSSENERGSSKKTTGNSANAELAAKGRANQVCD